MNEKWFYGPDAENVLGPLAAADLTYYAANPEYRIIHHPETGEPIGWERIPPYELAAQTGYHRAGVFGKFRLFTFLIAVGLCFLAFIVGHYEGDLDFAANIGVIMGIVLIVGNIVTVVATIIAGFRHRRHHW